MMSWFKLHVAVMWAWSYIPTLLKCYRIRKVCLRGRASAFMKYFEMQILRQPLRVSNLKEEFGAVEHFDYRPT